MTYIEELTQVIKELHGADAVHVETVAVKEVFQGETMWDGKVEDFDLVGHPDTHRVYAWGFVDDNDQKQHVTVLHIPPATSPENAVRASIVSEYGNRN